MTRSTTDDPARLIAETADLASAPVLVTGAAGFIGYHVAERLVAQGVSVVGVDNFSPYYDVALKEARAARLMASSNFRLERLDLADRAGTAALFAEHRPRLVIHLAAQAGVRHSLKDPDSYADANLVGFLNILEGARHGEISHLVYASSSSVYGGNGKMPFSTSDAVDHPLSLYAATKKANELMAHCYSHLYRVPTTGLRFFTVYGPWGRPDMALFLFTKAILEGRPIDVFNFGNMKRDFTYIDDIVDGVLAISAQPAAPDPTWSALDPRANTSSAPYQIFNIGNHAPVELMKVISLLEAETGRVAEKRMLPISPGDVVETYADIEGLVAATGIRPAMPIEEGVRRFVAWYRDYYRV